LLITFFQQINKSTNQQNINIVRIILLFVFGLPFLLKGQTELNLLGTWSDPSLPVTAAWGGAYNEIWGLVVNDHEIAVIGSTMGTHFIDVTDPTNPIELTNAFVQGATFGPALVHRDFHDYRGFLYVVADEDNNSTLQIVDIRNLPESTTVISDNNDLLIRSHNVFVDSTQARLYACGIRRSTGRDAMSMYDISDPTNPVELGIYNNFGNVPLPYVHDIFVRDHIAYLNAGNDGFFVVDFTDPDNPILLGTMNDYEQAGYNHSGWLDHTGNYYFLADENHGLDLKVVDVCEPEEDIEVVETFGTGSGIPSSIPHNVLIDCNILYASWYYEGVQVFDISDPINPVRIGFYDTFSGPDAPSFAGNWGVYPYLPSGNILGSDMQSGLFILERNVTPDCDAYQATNCANAVPVSEVYQPVKALNIYPQPVSDQLTIDFFLEEPTADLNFSLTDVSGRQVATWNDLAVFTGENKFNLDIPNSLNNGFYIMVIENEDDTVGITRKVVVQR